MTKQQPIRILIAEDEDSFRMVLQRVILSNNEYEFDACADGDEVLQVLKEKSYDVIILDHQMPGRSGLNILQWMYEQKLDTPVIMLTGAGSEHIAVEAMKLGAYDYIRKEAFEKEHLPHIINSAHERYLFRKERILREQRSQDDPKKAETMNLLFGCIRAIEDLLNTSLRTTDTEIETREKEILQTWSDENSKTLGQTLSHIRQEFEVIALGSKSLVDLAKIMLEHLTTTVTNDNHERELKHLLERIEALNHRGHSESN